MSLKKISNIKQTTPRVLRYIGLSLVVTVLSGCFGGYYHATPNGQQVDFASPMLTTSERQGGTYVLVEKSLADGKYQLLDISQEKQKITNSRQERIVFTKDLQKYSVDFDEYQWETYVDHGNYAAKSEIMRCVASVSRDKIASYNPCSSDFHYTFVPMSVTKAYVAGRMSKATKDAWEDPRQNIRIQADNPWRALSESGAIAKLGITRVDR